MPGLVGCRLGQSARLLARRDLWHSVNVAAAISNHRTHYAYASAGQYEGGSISRRDFHQRGFTVGIGGPVGSGKTALVLQLCRSLPVAVLENNFGVVTNDIFTQEDAEFLQRHQVLDASRIRAVETGGCPHAAIREDVSANLSALESLTAASGRTSDDASRSITGLPPLLLCESGGDNLAANFSRELADLTLYVIDVAGGDKVPRKGGPGITQSDLLIINKVDLAPAVGADLDVMRRDADKMRTPAGGGVAGPTILAAVKHGEKLQDICDFIMEKYHEAVGATQETCQNQSH